MVLGETNVMDLSRMPSQKGHLKLPPEEIKVTGNKTTGPPTKPTVSSVASRNDSNKLPGFVEMGLHKVGRFNTQKAVDQVRSTERIDTAKKRQKRKFSRRTRSGCQTCRRRKKKCDETRPSCMPFVHNEMHSMLIVNGI